MNLINLFSGYLVMLLCNAIFYSVLGATLGYFEKQIIIQKRMNKIPNNMKILS
jgi:hypothetical protein